MNYFYVCGYVELIVEFYVSLDSLYLKGGWLMDNG